MHALRKILLAVWIPAGAVAIAAGLMWDPLDPEQAQSWARTLFPLAMTIFTVAGLAWLVTVVATHRSKWQSRPPP